MVKKLDIEDLDIGMYIASLDRPWQERPFLLNFRKIKEHKIIDKLKSFGIKYVFIDTLKGNDSNRALPKEEHDKKINKLILNRFKKQKNENLAPNDEDFQNDLNKAIKLKQEANNIVSNLMRDVRFGKNIDKDRIYPVINEMVMSTLRNPDALLSLAQLKHYDNNTFIHSVNVSCLAIAFGHFLGLDKGELFKLALGGILHDIGKILVPQNLLNKSSPLLKEEFDILKLHVSQGQEYLTKNCKINSESFGFVSEHHERYDGTGYPLGLKKNTISLFGQIAGIIDAYDAMTMGRAYYNKLNYFEALKLLFGYSNTMFNKYYVEKFIECIGIYPAGLLVRLNDNKLAYVWKINHKMLLRPTVIFVYNLISHQYIAPQKKNLALPQNEKLEIVAVEDLA